MQSKKNRILGLLVLSIFLIQSILLVNNVNNVRGLQDDDDLEVALHAKLESDSTEIYSSLMPLGSYTYFETPQLNIGDFSHDITKIEVSDIQYSTSNETSGVIGSFLDIIGNQTINSSKIPQYTISAEKDTIIKANIEYTTNTSCFAYAGNHFDVGSKDAQPHGITWDGSSFWIIGDFHDRVYKYSSSGIYTGVNFDLSSEDTNPYGIAWDGSNFWIIGHNNLKVYKYSSSGIYTGVNFDVSSEDTNPSGITWDGSSFWITGDVNNKVYEYTAGGSYTGTNFDVSSEDTNPSGITWDGSSFWLIGNFHDRVYKYSSSGIYTGVNFDVSSEDILPWDLTWNGDSLWVEGALTDEVYQYTTAEFISDVYLNNFTYSILGVNYTESFQLKFDSLNSNKSINGTLSYYISSADFTYFNHTQNLLILSQNLSLTFDLTLYNVEFNYNITILYSLNEFKFPSELNLRINNHDVIDETYKTGLVFLENYPETLTITSDLSDIYFRLNITTEFVFYFDLEVISKTYLSQSFKLISNHLISFNRIDLPTTLEIKKIYLNTLDLGTDNPNLLFPEISMIINDVYSIEVILAEELYIPLSSADYEQIYSNSFNSLTSEMKHSYFPNASYNTTYSINSGDLKMKSEFPNELHKGNLTDSWNLDYNSSYTNSSYYNGNLSSHLNTYSNTGIPLQPDNFTLTNGTSDWSGNLEAIDSNYTTFTSTLGGYDATYDFNDQDAGTSSTNITFIDYDGSSASCSVSLTDEGAYHWNTLDLYDNNAAGVVDAYNEFSTQTTGRVEWWWKASNTDLVYTTLRSGATYAVDLIMIGGEFKYYSGGSWNVVRTYSADTWYHHRIDFDTTTDKFTWYINKVLEANNVDFEAAVSSINRFWVITDTGSSNYHADYNAIGYSWESYGLYDNYENNGYAELEFDTIFQMQHKDNETIDYAKLYYSHKTDGSTPIKLSIWDYTNSEYDLIENVTNTATFDDDFYELNSEDHWNATYHVKIKYEENSTSADFHLYLEKLKILYNSTKTSGEIYASNQKSINYTFLNYYDSFSNYQQIYNVSIQFSYRFSNYTKYSYFAKFLYQTNDHNLNVSGNWYNFSQSFIFNSSSVNSFVLSFNITNGLLELNNMNYSIWFKCLDLQNNTKLYQYFKLTPNLDALDWYEKIQSRMILNILYIFTNTSYLVDYNNSIDFSYLLFKINVLSESGWISSSYTYNKSRSNTLSVNLYQILTANSKSQFYNFSVELYLSGNNSQITVSDLILYNQFDISSIQLTANPSTDVNSVDFLEFYQSNRSFSYWYYENQSQLNDIYLIHKSSSTTISSFVNTSNNRYYFQQSSQTNDLFEVYPDYKPNWQISTSITENTKTTTKIKIDYSADLDISGASLVLTLTRGDLFGDVELNQNQNQNLTLIVPNIDFTTNTQTLYVTGSRTQKTTNPHVNYDSVEFYESYYYGDLLLNLYTIDVNPNWDVIHSVVSNTGIYSKVKVNYKADLAIENVDISFNLKNDGCYNENWTLGAQTIDYTLTIPNVDFTNEVQILYVEGSSSIPYASISSFETDQNFNRIAEDTEINFAGFLTYPKYTQIFGLNINSSWTCYNVYYGNENYAVESLSNTSIKVLGSGFDPKINDSYLHFTMKPFVNVDWQYESNVITITINSTMDVDNAFFLYQFDPEGVHTLELQSSYITINDLSDSGDSDGYLTFNTPRVPKGITIIKIKVNFATPLEMFIQSIIIFSVCGVFIGIYYYLKNSEKAMKKVKGFVSKKVLDKLKKRKEEKGVSEVVLEIKNNKIHLKKK